MVDELRIRVKEMRMVRAGDLLPHPDNWREHPKQQRDLLNNVLNEVGFAGAMLAFETNNGQLMLIDGHVRQEEIDADVELPTLITDLTESEARTLLLTHDPISDLATAKAETLKALIKKQKNLFSGLDKLKASLAEHYQVDVDDTPPPAEDPGAQVDRVKELQEKWQVKRGDVWQVGKHRVMCCDSTDFSNLGRIMRLPVNKNRPKIAIITDPPYAFGLASTMNMAVKSGGWHDMMNNASWFVDRYNQWSKLLKASCIWVFTNWRSLPILMRAAHDSGVGMNSVMVWYKDWIGPGGPVGLRPTYELICLTVTDKIGIKSRSIEDFYKSEWSAHKPTGHQAEKPEKLLSHLVNITNADITFDPFLGSGTTIVACEQTGRVGYGMEISPEYVAVTLERLSGIGLEPYLVED